MPSYILHAEPLQHNKIRQKVPRRSSAPTKSSGALKPQWKTANAPDTNEVLVLLAFLVRAFPRELQYARTPGMKTF
jgi:hypothetical protein